MSPAKYENYSENCDNLAPERHPAASGGVNESAPGTPIGTQLTHAGSRPVHGVKNTNYNADPTCFLPPNDDAAYPFDCAARRAKDLTQRMKLTVLISSLKTGTRAGFLERQIGIVKSHKVRVAAKTEVAL